MLKRKLEIFGKRLFVTGIVLGLFLAGCAGSPEVTSDAGAVEKEEVVDSKEEDVLQEQEVQAEDERQEEANENDADSQDSNLSQETSDIEDEKQDLNAETPDEFDVIAAIDSFKEDIFTEEQLQELYGSIQESVKSKYLDQNGIDPKDFKWPKSLDVDGVDEDNSWLYLSYICVEYISTGELYSIKGFEADLPSEQNRNLMNSVLDGMIAWDHSSGNNDFNMIKLALIPMEEKIPANVNFSD